MKTQTDLFGVGETRSFPPHLDPAKVVCCRVRADTDRDHVGAGEVERYGNNAGVYVFEVLGPREIVLHAETFMTPDAAEEQLEHHEAMLEAHRQRELF
jgi:hypothetical protein